VDDAAFGNAPTRTSRKGVAELAAKPFERRDLSFDHRQVPRGDLVNSRARILAMPSEIEQLAHILDGKAKLPCPPDEGEAMHVLARIAAVVAARSCR